MMMSITTMMTIMMMMHFRRSFEFYRFTHQALSFLQTIVTKFRFHLRTILHQARVKTLLDFGGEILKLIWNRSSCGAVCSMFSCKMIIF